MKEKIGIIIQSRLTSKRFPEKVLEKIDKRTITEIIYNRLSLSKKINSILFAIPLNSKNDKLFHYLNFKKFKVFRGSEDNVLSRYYLAAKKNKLDIIVRITGDCPLADPRIVDQLITKFKYEKLDYLTTSPTTFPDGFDVEIFRFKVLKDLLKKVKNEHDLEHVTTYIKKNRKKFKFKEFQIKKNNLSQIKLSLDTKRDLKNIKKIFKYFSPNIDFSLKDMLKRNISQKLFKKELENKKSLILKTEEGQKLWIRAKNKIAGGNMILSKNPERFLPDLWPTYYKWARGCKIKDYDNNLYIDMSLMGVGTNVLGYSNKVIDNAVKKAISIGNMSTLNCKEEVLLAERLIELHPWFEKVKFAKTGGEANAIAIRLARAFTGKDNIAVCGYHGWHDWYLSANLQNKKGLQKHLLKGLMIKGVPKKLANTVFPFEYGNFNQLKKICKKKKIGTIKMEVCRNTAPNIKFLKQVRNFTKKNNIILIFDECTTGFRETLGGLHKKINIKPDMCIFGKAMGNGYPITAVLGKEEIMNSINNSFVSSTFWSERAGYVAALKTIQYMEKYKIWKKIYKNGTKIKYMWKKLFKKHNLSVQINGIPSLLSFTFSNNHQKYKTYISQEMLKMNFLCSNQIYCSISHNNLILKKYFFKLDKILSVIEKCEKGENIDNLLISKVSMSDFGRLN